ncbi:hypothetical protein [Hyphococcus sp.]|uniref:hypothetical protein n=1 Tax=Hyphococcus sp. TaxID=2038636 RepID=UPI0035C7882A
MAALYHYHSEAEVIRIGEGFASATLPKAAWTHGAHWAAAFWLILKRPDIDPERDMPGMIRRYNDAVGTPNTDSEGYHETITRGSLIIAREFIAQQADDPLLHELCNRLFASRFGRNDWLFEHWSKDVLFSAKARKQWVAPNLNPLRACLGN